MSKFVSAMVSILSIIAIVYLFIVLIDLLLVFIFNRILRRHDKALSLILKIKSDNVLELINLAKKFDPNFDSNYLKKLKKINKNLLLRQYKNEAKISRDNLTYLVDEIFSYLRSKKIYEKNKEIDLIKQNIYEQDKQYRNLVIAYNADALGYNYWVSFILTRYIFKLFKIYKIPLI